MAAPPSHHSTEGHVEVGDHATWFKRVTPDSAARDKTPLLLLHGGPGLNSEYFASLQDALAPDRTVIRYDQAASGRSESPAGRTIDGFTPFMEELSGLREQLGLDRVHILGHSWGGMLAMEYALTAPAGVQSLVLASSPFSAPLWAEETTRLRQALPARAQAVLETCEAHDREGAGTAAAAQSTPRRALSDAQLRRWGWMLRVLFAIGRLPAVQALALPMSRVPPLRGGASQLAQVTYNRRHVCRLDRPPPEFFRSIAGWNVAMYNTIWGPSEFHVSGALKEWDLSGRLGQITVPTLITSGRYDEATPGQMEQLANAIGGSRLVVFEESAHMAHMEEPDRYVQVLTGFLADVEAGR